MRVLKPADARYHFTSSDPGDNWEFALSLLRMSKEQRLVGPGHCAAATAVSVAGRDAEAGLSDVPPCRSFHLIFHGSSELRLKMNVSCHMDL